MNRKTAFQIFANIRALIILLFGLSFSMAHADDDKLLRPEQAFRPSVTAVTPTRVDIRIDIEPQHYLYQNQRFSLTNKEGALALGDITLSDGIEKHDDFFGTQSVWYGGKNTADIRVDYTNPERLKNATLILKYQGCRDGVLCYPPQRVELPVELPELPEAPEETLQAEMLETDAAQPPQANPLSLKTPSPQWKKNIGAPRANTAAILAGKKPPSQALLSEDEAFAFSLSPAGSNTNADADSFSALQLKFRIAEDYYLYRDKLTISEPQIAQKNEQENSGLIANVEMAKGQSHYDEFKGEQVIYRDEAVGNIYLKRAVKSLTLRLQFQGCAEKLGVCYPVMTRDVTIKNGEMIDMRPVHKSNDTNAVRSEARADMPTGVPNSINNPNNTAKNSASASENNALDTLTNTLRHNLWAGVGLLLVMGIALSFTPCVLPMLPILLSIITNQRQVSKPRALVLSSAYALGVATMMAVFGLVVAKTGINLQIIFQQPLWLIVFAGIFISMGLAMLGVFSLAMPNSVQTRIIQWQNHFQNSRASSLFIVGALSTLVVGPCVAPPLIAVLAFISTTGDSTLGAVYLFALGLGMSLPLVVFASLVTKVPKTGALSRLVTRIFAMLMFGVGLWLLGRLWSGSLSLMLWGVFFVALAWVFLRSDFIQPRAIRVVQALAVACALLGGVWLIGGATGHSNPLHPFTKVIKLPFRAVHTIEELNRALADSDKPVMLDVYADWCVSCQEVEHFTLNNAKVAEALEDFTLLKLDITDTNEAHRALLAQYDLIGPPVMMFFKQQKEVRALRHVGAIDVETLLDTLGRVQRE